MLLSGLSALVTGAADRLGAEIARTLHQNGANLIIHYRRSEAAAVALAETLCASRSGSAVTLQADLANSDDIVRLPREACAQFDGLDILVNNASSFYPTPLGEIDEAAWDDLVSSNFKAPLFLTQACAPALRKSGGCVINLVDVYASRPVAGYSLYCAAKAANRTLVESLALELAPEVRVNGIAPGAMLLPGQGNDDPAQRAQLEASVPLRRLGGAQVIADTALFLATNNYITGEIVRVDGGRQLT